MKTSRVQSAPFLVCGGGGGVVVVVVVVVVVGASLVAWSSGCESNSSADPNDPDAQPPFCTPELIDSGFAAFCDASLDLNVGPPNASSSSSGDVQQIILKLVELTGTCVGKSQSDNNCTLNPTDSTSTSTVTFAESSNRNTGAIFNRVVGPPPYCGAITAAAVVKQPAASGTKLCPPSIAPESCTEFKGEDDVQPFAVTAEIEGGTGESSMIRFKVESLQPPSACTAHVFDDINKPENTWFVPLSPPYSFGALRTTGVTLTGKNTFPIDGAGAGGLVGSLECEYTVKIRPSNSAGD